MAVGSNYDDLLKATARARANQLKAQEAAKAMAAQIKGNPPPAPRPADDQAGKAKP